MTAEEFARRERAARRNGTMSVHKSKLHQPEVDFSPVRGAAGISLLTQLTRESFALAGRPLPDSSRDNLLVRFVPLSGR